MRQSPPPYSVNSSRHRGFSLVEILVATAVLAILLSLILTILNSVSTTMRHTTAKVDAFASARAAFTILSQRLSQATLNTYWAFDKPWAYDKPNEVPTAYLRASDLHFAIKKNSQSEGYGQEVYFHAPQSYSSNSDLRATEGLLNANSFFVHFGSNDDFRPGNLSEKKYRYRLMQGIQPTESLKTFDPTRPSPGSLSWADSISNTASPGSLVTPIADNVIAAIVWPRLSPHDDKEGTQLSADYTYDSQDGAKSNPQPITANQLPPMVQLTLVVISEASANRLDKGGSRPTEIESALNGKFTEVKNYQTDLAQLQKALTDQGIEYEVFTTTVPMSGSKWSNGN